MAKFDADFNQEFAASQAQLKGYSLTETTGAYDATVNYGYGQIVTRCGCDFQSQQSDNLGLDPVLNSGAAWNKIGTNLTFWQVGDYRFDIVYAQNKVVLHNGVAYHDTGVGGVAAGKVPGVTGSGWTAYTVPAWADTNAYLKGDFVGQGGALYIATAHSVVTTSVAPATDNDQWRQPLFNGSPIAA